ncbi:MAG: hypothetical protein ABFD82_22145 [Syntrophaceae bacterium]
MRSLQYNLLPPVGDGQTPVYGDLLDLLQAIPYLLSDGLIPPLVVLNHIFQMGVYDAGMSGGITWEPFEIDQTEFNELVNGFVSLKNTEYRLVVTPDWVKTNIHWLIWKMEYLYKIPSEEHIRLWEEDEHWTRLHQEAIVIGDTKKVDEYYIKSMQAGNRLSKFLMAYIDEYRKKKESP